MVYKAPSTTMTPTPFKRQRGRLSARIRRCPSSFMSALKFLRDYFASFFRSVGLAIIPTTGGVEEPKVLLRQSWKTALARCGVHLLPSIVSLIVVSVNLMTVYIGKELVGPSGQDDIKLSVLQVCAKVQELLIVGSMAAIIFHVLRSRLLTREGLPLGLLGSGFAFTQLSFFWSTDFIGSLGYVDSSRFHKSVFIALLIVSGLIAVFAGPATAILMIPRTMDWAMGGSVVWLNGTKEEMWPSVLNNSTLEGYDCSTDDAKLTDPSCPSAGYQAIYNHINTWQSAPIHYLGNIDLFDSRIRKSVSYRIRDPIKWPGHQTWSATAHEPTAHTQLATQGLWASALGWAFGESRNIRVPPSGWLASFPDTQIFKTKADVPAIRSRCSTDQSQFTNPLEEEVYIYFPDIPDHLFSENIAVIPLTAEYKEQLYRRIQNAGDIEPGQAFTLSIPVADIGLGIAVIMPAVSDNGTLTGDWTVMGCSSAGYWAPGTVITTFAANGVKYSFEKDQGGSRAEIEVDDDGFGWGNFVAPRDGTFKRIDIQPTWLDLAAPRLDEPEEDKRYAFPANRTMLESLLSVVVQKYPFEDQSAVVMSEHVIATMLADSVSRVSSHQTSNYSSLLEPVLSTPWTKSSFNSLVRVGNPIEAVPRPPGDVTKLTMRTFLQGYVMAATGWFDYISIALLLSHALIALLFTLWVVLWRRTTSDVWETIPELLVLAQNSPAPDGDVLSNTSAGIRQWGTPAVMAWIEDCSKDDESAGPAPLKEQLRLRFGEYVHEKRDASKKCVPGVAYGKKVD